MNGESLLIMGAVSWCPISCLTPVSMKPLKTPEGEPGSPSGTPSQTFWEDCLDLCWEPAGSHQIRSSWFVKSPDEDFIQASWLLCSQGLGGMACFRSPSTTSCTPTVCVVPKAVGALAAVTSGSAPFGGGNAHLPPFLNVMEPRGGRRLSRPLILFQMP
ncbi:unnamed protein product [Boreogadus saida]